VGRVVASRPDRLSPLDHAIRRVRRLAGVIESELEIAQTFGTGHVLRDAEGPANPAPDLL